MKKLVALALATASLSSFAAAGVAVPLGCNPLPSVWTPNSGIGPMAIQTFYDNAPKQKTKTAFDTFVRNTLVSLQVESQATHDQLIFLSTGVPNQPALATVQYQSAQILPSYAYITSEALRIRPCYPD